MPALASHLHCPLLRKDRSRLFLADSGGDRTLNGASELPS